MNLSIQGATTALSLSLQALNGGLLRFYSGTQPATPETDLSGNTLLATLTFNNPAFGTPTFSSGQLSALASFVSGSVSPVTGGTTTWARGIIVASGAWAISTSYSFGQIVSQNNRYYVCCRAGTSASSGGPGSQTGFGYQDGTTQVNGCAWNYIGPVPSGSTVTGYADFSVSQGVGSDIQLGQTLLSTNTPLNISSLVIQMAAA